MGKVQEDVNNKIKLGKTATQPQNKHVIKTTKWNIPQHSGGKMCQKRQNSITRIRFDYKMSTNNKK